MPRLKSQHVWITNGTENKLISTKKPIPRGWHHGRNIASAKKKIICQNCSDSFTAFKQKRGDDGLVRCPACARRKAQNRHLPKQRNKWLLTTYGITLEQYNQMLIDQNNACAICKKPETKQTIRGDRTAFLSVDHDHKTGKVRGLLCNACNVALGHFSEHRLVLQSAINYLIGHAGIPTWDEYFMNVALMAATRSKDPSTKVGAVIVRDKKIISTGYNGLPRRMDDTNQAFWERPQKYTLVIHAEQNAILQSQGESLKDTTLYCTLFPCIECAKSIIQAGISEIVYQTDFNPRFKENFEKSLSLLQQCGVATRKLDWNLSP